MRKFLKRVLTTIIALAFYFVTFVVTAAIAALIGVDGAPDWLMTLLVILLFVYPIVGFLWPEVSSFFKKLPNIVRRITDTRFEISKPEKVDEKTKSEKKSKRILRGIIFLEIYVIIFYLLPKDSPTVVMTLELLMIPCAPVIGYYLPDILDFCVGFIDKTKVSISSKKEIAKEQQREHFNQHNPAVPSTSKNDNRYATNSDDSIKNQENCLDLEPPLEEENEEDTQTEQVEPEKEYEKDLITETLERIDSLAGYKFEEWCAELLLMAGFESAVVTKRSGDGGGDVVAVDKGGTKYAIQCKRYAQKVGNFAIGDALRAKNNYQCDKAVVMTNNYFTPKAIAESKPNETLLWDRDTIAQFMKESGKFGYTPEPVKPLPPDDVSPEAEKPLPTDSISQMASADSTFQAESPKTVTNVEREPTYFEMKAIQKAKDYEDSGENYSMSQLIKRLISDGFTGAEAQFAAEYIETKGFPNKFKPSNIPFFHQQAVEAARDLVECNHYSKNELIIELINKYGFTLEQATFAADEIEKPQ